MLDKIYSFFSISLINVGFVLAVCNSTALLGKTRIKPNLNSDKAGRTEALTTASPKSVRKQLERVVALRILQAALAQLKVLLVCHQTCKQDEFNVVLLYELLD